MNLRCDCGVPFHAKNVNVAAAIATCEACGAVVSIAQSEARASPATMAVPDAFAVPTSDRGSDGSYRVAATGGATRIVYRWFRASYLLLLLFFLVWDAVCSQIVMSAWHDGNWLLVLLPHLWIGILGSYWVVAHLVNRSTFALGPEGLVVSAGPLPWRGVRVPRSEIAEFDASTGGVFNASARTMRTVRVVGTNRRARRLIGGLNEEAATFLVNELQRALRAS